MFKFLDKFFSTAFSGFGIPICQKLSKKLCSKNNKSKRNNQSDQEIILYAIDHYGKSKQEEIFMRYFYKYKNKFSADDVKNLTQKMEEEHPNYCILLNILFGLIDSPNL